MFFFLPIKLDGITRKVQFDAPETDFICRCDENSLMRFRLPLRAGLLLIYVKLARVLNRSHVLMREEESSDFQREEKVKAMLYQLF